MWKKTWFFTYKIQFFAEKSARNSHVKIHDNSRKFHMIFNGVFFRVFINHGISFKSRQLTYIPLSLPDSLFKWQKQRKNVQTSQNSIHGNLLDSLILYSYGIFLAQTNTQVAKTWEFLRSGVVSHSKSALETNLRDKIRWPTLPHFFNLK